MFHQLEVEYDYDFLLLGISCHEKDYRLCWFLNKELDLNLELRDEVEVAVKRGKSSHSLFTFVNKDEQVSFSLVVNRSEGGLICPEYPQVDYLLKVEDEMLNDLQDYLARIRKIPIVITAFEIPVKSLKSKHNLIFE